MSKRRSVRRQKNARFWLIMAIYAEVFLILVGLGLMAFWDFIAAYEAACPPQQAMDAYGPQVTADKLLDMEWEAMEGLESDLQTAEDRRAILATKLQYDFVFAKDLANSTDRQVVYTVKCRLEPVGSVTVSLTDTDRYGFEHWSVTGDEYDLNAMVEELVSQPATVTVPSDWKVYARRTVLENGQLALRDLELDDTKVVERRTEYRLREDGASYEEVSFCTYAVGPVLGELSLVTRDPSGAVAEYDATADERPLLTPCQGEELERVDEFLGRFVQCYVDFTSVTGGKKAMQGNYNDLAALIVDDTKLEQRMEEAMVGLVWVTDRKASVGSMTINNCFLLEEGRWLCDFTYVVNTRDHSGKVEVTNHVRMIVVETEDGLLAEAMSSY